MFENKTTSELLERLAGDQRILEEEKKRLLLIREKELEQQELERAEKSVNVVEKLRTQVELLTKQDEILKGNRENIKTLEEKKQTVLAEKEKLKVSEQKEVDQLQQDGYDLLRNEIIGLERVEEEIQNQAKKEIIESTTEELNKARDDLVEKCKRWEQNQQKYKDLEKKIALDKKIDETNHKIALLKSIEMAMDAKM